MTRPTVPGHFHRTDDVLWRWRVVIDPHNGARRWWSGTFRTGLFAGWKASRAARRRDVVVEWEFRIPRPRHGGAPWWMPRDIAAAYLASITPPARIDLTVYDPQPNDTVILPVEDPR